MTQPPLPRRPPLPLLAAALVALVLVVAVLPNLGGGRSDSTTTTVNPLALSERPPFGRPLPGYLAYLAADRTFVLVDLVTGELLGSKGVPGDRRAAAASNTAAFLGNLPRGSEEDGNWDELRSLEWQGTSGGDHGEGLAIVYSQQINTIAKAMRPLPDGGNGVRFVSETDAWDAASSPGFWSLPVWMGDRLLVRELRGDAVLWWLLDGTGPGEPEPVDLPDEFLPIAGTDGLVMGQLGDDGVIIDLATGEASRLTGRFSWAAAWRPVGDPILATVGGEPPALIGYTPNGLFAWSVPLRDNATRFRGGVAWSPDGTYVVAPARGTIDAVTASGGTIGELDTSLPAPEAKIDTGFVTLVPRPPG